MKEDKKEMLLSYIKANVAPILVDFLKGEDLEGALILPANIPIEELNGHYEEEKFMPPKWLKKLCNSKVSTMLVIDKIDSIPKGEQLKFCELLEYRKISTFDLPDNCVILVTADKINKERINEEIYSLVAQIDF